MEYGTEGIVKAPAFIAEGATAGEEENLILPSVKAKELLEYVHVRIKSTEADRKTRIARYADVDRAISTWMMYSQEDAERERMEDTTGRSQALPSNLPLLAAHVDSTVAFFTEVFAPESKDFFTVPGNLKNADQAQELVSRLNRDTRYTGYHRVLARTIRCALKYNIFGMGVEYREQTEGSDGGNLFRHVDLYNVSWDKNVKDPSRISEDGEWVAEYEITNAKQLMRGIKHKGFDGVGVRAALDQEKKADSEKVRYYVSPPNHAGLTFDGKNGVKGDNKPNWDSYFPALQGASALPGMGADSYELQTVHIWLDPKEFGLVAQDVDSQYQLWRFIFVDGQHLIHAKQIVDPGIEEENEMIPVIFGLYTDDDISEAQRSPVELMRPFQRFASFLMNIWILGARKAVFGVTYYDPTVFNPSDMKEGQVAGFIKMKVSNRDIRSAMYKDPGQGAPQDVINMLTQVLELTRTFYPDQALPAQVAGIQRATTNQVSAVMNTGQAKLRLQARLLDSGVLAKIRLQAFRNHQRFQGEGLKGLTDEEVSVILGSGLRSFDAERIQMILREIMNLIGGNQELIQEFDMVAMLNAFGDAMNLPFKLGDFYRGAASQREAGVENPIRPSEAAAAQQQQQVEAPPQQ